MEPRGPEWDLVRFLRFECLKVSGICWMLDVGWWLLGRVFIQGFFVLFPIVL